MARDPKLNEKLLLHDLRDTRATFTPNGIRSLCSLSLMCAWDRRVEREFYAKMLDQVALINIDLSDMESIGRLRQYVLETKGDVAPLDAEAQKVVEEFMHKRGRLADQLDLVSQCPLTTDTVH